MGAWLDDLRGALRQREADHLLRSLTPVVADGPLLIVNGETLVNLASNDYLGLSRHPHVIAAAVAATQKHGVGSGASRLVSGTSELHDRVERRFAAFKHAQAAMLCPTGYMANLAVMTALASGDDVICLDKLCHASLIDAARASGATVRVYPHLELNKLRKLLERHATARRRFIVTDSVFSMDGDTADLPALCGLAEQFNAIVVADEAHGTGVLGATGAGLCELQGVSQRVHVIVSTASKAMGGLGGIVTARQEVVDTLINHARPFIYTTGATPSQAAAIDAAMDVIEREPHRRQRLAELSRRLRQAIDSLGLTTVQSRDAEEVTPIIPVVMGDAEAALRLASHLRGEGFFAPAIRPPTVAPGAARVRISLRADLEDDHIVRLIESLRSANIRC